LRLYHSHRLGPVKIAWDFVAVVFHQVRCSGVIARHAWATDRIHCLNGCCASLAGSLGGALAYACIRLPRIVDTVSGPTSPETENPQNRMRSSFGLTAIYSALEDGGVFVGVRGDLIAEASFVNSPKMK